MRKIGITGGIASGKSLVGSYLLQQGVPVLDTDEVVHQLYASDAELNALILEHFGPEVFAASGQVDRVKLGGQVFSNPEQLRLLESWIHPKVREKANEFLATRTQQPLAVVLIPLLFESNLERFYDEVWLVVANPEQQIERMMKNRSLTQAEAELRLSRQLSLAEKKKRTPYWIDNSGSPEQTYQSVQALINQAS